MYALITLLHAQRAGISRTQSNTPAFGAQYIHFGRVWMGALLEPRMLRSGRATVSLGPPTWPLADPVAPRCGRRTIMEGPRSVGRAAGKEFGSSAGQTGDWGGHGTLHAHKRSRRLSRALGAGVSYNVGGKLAHAEKMSR
jgi:hypothetical protein